MAASNTGPLIWLAKAALLDLLRKTYQITYITPTVETEAIKAGREKGYDDADSIGKAIEEGWITVDEPSDASLKKARKIEESLEAPLERGEREAIALSLDRDAPFLTNDERTRLVAKAPGIEAHGVLYLLLRAVGEGNLRKGEARRALTDMLRKGVWLSPTMVDRFHQVLDEFAP
jgi:predicted nucleic acid-binding protein